MSSIVPIKIGTVPRILILDNDETTGSYNLLFHLYDYLAVSDIGKRLQPAITLNAITHCFKNLGVFRPGLTRFLKTASSLKKKNRLDKIIMYTNQLDCRHTRNIPIWHPIGGEWSVPMMIQIMLVHLADDPKLIDEILTRPLRPTHHIGDYPVKDFVRAYRSVYPTGPVNLSKTLFFDDLAEHPYVIDSSDSKTDANSRFPLDGYSRKLRPSAFRYTVKNIFEANHLTPSAEDVVLMLEYERRWYTNNLHVEDTGLEETLDEYVPLLKGFYSKED